MTTSPPSAKTIQIYLPKGNPRGIRSAEMTTRTVRLIEIPRIYIDDFFAMPESNQVGLYFLVSDNERIGKPLLYIGQTGDLKRRINQHDSKDFWTRAFVMLSTNNSMTQTHALYMEHKAIDMAKKAERYELLNGNNGNKPHTTDPLKADCEELFHTLSILLSTMGQPIFQSLSIHKNRKSTVINDLEHSLFYFNSTYAEAKGYYNEDGFVVLSGSIIRKETVESLKDKKVLGIRETLKSEGKLVNFDNENSYQLTEDYIFSSPSSASKFVAGRSCNGWDQWKNESGETLDSVYR